MNRNVSLSLTMLLILSMIIFPFISYASEKKEVHKDFFSEDIDYLISRMSLEEKIGQLLIFGFYGKRLPENVKDWLESGKLGNIKIFLRNVNGRQQLKALTESINTACKKSKWGIPPFIATDVEGGIVNHIRSDDIPMPPSAALVSASGSVRLAELSARLIAYNFIDLGINMNFAPCFDVLTDPRNRVIDTRSYGSSPDVVYMYGYPMVDEFSKYGIVAVPKHFPGHGMSNFDSHTSSESVEILSENIMGFHLVPYFFSISGGKLNACMLSNVIYRDLDGMPATLSPVVADIMLKGFMGFTGILITDDLEMKGAEDIAGDPVNAFILSFKAGCDLFLYAHSTKTHRDLIKSLPGLFKKGVLSIDSLNIKVRKVLELKKRMLYRFYRSNYRLNSPEGYLEKVIDETYEEVKNLSRRGITLLTSRLEVPVPEYFSELKSRWVKGLVISPNEGFEHLARSFLPGWDVVNSGFFPSVSVNKRRIKAFKKRKKKYEIALIGFATERQIDWINMLREMDIPYIIFIIGNPLRAVPFVKDSLFSVASYDPYSPAIDELFEECFYYGNFRGSFPYNLVSER